MTVIQWLSRARNVSREVEILERSRREEYERVTAIASQLSGSAGVSATKNPHKFDRLAEYSEALQRREEELLTLKREISDAISRVEDSHCRIILHLRYCDCRSWKEVAHIASYSDRGCRKIHDRGVSLIAEMLGLPAEKCADKCR